MNTDNKFIVNSKIINDILNSSYEFNRFSKDKLSKDTSLNSLSLQADPDSKWSKIGNVLLKEFWKKNKDFEEERLICFIHSPWLSEQNRIVRYRKLSRFFSKDLEVKNLGLVSEIEFNVDGKIGYYGFVELNDENTSKLLQILSDHGNGVIFTCKRSNNSLTIENIVNILQKSITIDHKSEICRTNIVQAIESVTDLGHLVIFPYAWPETGNYHLDVFHKISSPA